MDTTTGSAVCQAIAKRRVISFDYKGERRLVEPHCHGYHGATGKESLRAYQIGGYSSSGRLGWKMYTVAKMAAVRIHDYGFTTRPLFTQNDSHLGRVHCHV